MSGMVLRGRLGLFLLISLLFIAPAYAYVNSTVQIGHPSSNALLFGDIIINATFQGMGNITVLYNYTDVGSSVYRTLNATDSVDQFLNISWPSANGSFPDGRYNFSITVVN